MSLFQKVSHFIISGAVIMLGFGALSVVAAPTTYAAGGCSSSFLTFPAWYDGLLDSKCNIKQPDASKANGAGLSTFIWRIVLNIIEIALQVIAYLTAGYIIYGGFRYLTSTGSSDKITAARKTITNAVIGLIISFLSIAVVTLIQGNITP